MTTFIKLWFAVASLCVCAVPIKAATLPEVVSQVEKMSRAEREAFLIKGAREEKDVMFYATTPVNQVAVLKKYFSARYPFVDLMHYYSPRQGILNKTLAEYRGNANLADVIMTDVSYGTVLMKEGVSGAYSTPDVQRYVRGSYDPKGQWYTMYMLTTALVYNRKLPAESGQISGQRLRAGAVRIAVPPGRTKVGQ